MPSWGTTSALDYNHRSLEGVDDHTGRAAGSFELEVRDTGIWATNVQWTETAADYIRKREYRYTSPVWNHDENGRPLEIFNLALTPNPAMLGYQPLVASAQPPPEEGKMLEKLRRQLGLSESATEEEILAKLASLQGAATQMASLAAMTSRTDPAEVVGVVQASLQSAAKVKTLEAENADLKRKVSESEITALVEEGEAQGKLTPAMASAIKGDDEGFAWAREPKALRAYLQVASAVVPMGEHQPDTTKIQTASILTAEDRQVAKQFGISEEDFAKQKGLSHAQ